MVRLMIKLTTDFVLVFHFVCCFFFSVSFVCLIFAFLETGSYYVTQAGLERSQSFTIYSHPSAGITGMHHQTQTICFVFDIV
jgi:hypothetical protein